MNEIDRKLEEEGYDKKRGQIPMNKNEVEPQHSKTKWRIEKVFGALALIKAGE